MIIKLDNLVKFLGSENFVKKQISYQVSFKLCYILLIYFQCKEILVDILFVFFRFDVWSWRVRLDNCSKCYDNRKKLKKNLWGELVNYRKKSENCKIVW